MEGWKNGRIADKARFVSYFTFLVCFFYFSFWGKHVNSQSQSTFEASYRSADALYQDGRYQQAAEKIRTDCKFQSKMVPFIIISAMPTFVLAIGEKPS